MFQLAHLSDCHIPQLPPVKLKQLLGKRFFGYLNWKYNRQFIHKEKILKTVSQKVLSKSPDHIVVTGDLVNIALPEEFLNARKWLEQLGTPDYLSLVPGNHDAYVSLKKGTGSEIWSDYMKSDKIGSQLIPNCAEQFPYVRYVNKNIALIGLSSAIPTQYFMATGTLGERQLKNLQKILYTLKNEKCFRIILIHHPPLSFQAKPKKALTDANSLQKILELEGAELILHGHNHKNTIEILETTSGPAPIVGVCSASSGKADKETLAGFNIYSIENLKVGNWRCEMQFFGQKTPNGTIEKIHQETLI